MTHTVTLDDILAARERIKPYIKRTALKEISPNVFLKAEHEQVTKSFKPRGACNAMLCLSDEEKERGVVSRSSGNFAQGLSYIGNALGVNVTIVMPEHAPKVKVNATKGYGARVILKGHQHQEAQAKVDQLALEEGLVKMHPYNHPNVIAGQGTAILEVAEDLDRVDYFFCQVSGGGLMAGCATAIKGLYPNAVVVGVEPELANDYYTYRKTGEFVHNEFKLSIADGLLVPCVGDSCKPLLDAYVDDVVSLSEEEIASATRTLHKIGELVEPSGAVAYGGYLSYLKDVDLEGKVVVCMASGGNYDPESFE